MSIRCVSSLSKGAMPALSHSRLHNSPAKHPLKTDRSASLGRRCWNASETSRLSVRQFSKGGVLKSDATMVKLVPPLFTAKTISQEAVCTRPMREDRFQISKEKIGPHEVIHCYGHGGAGATTMPGSVAKSMKEFEKDNPSKSKRIRVLGSGFMGLTNAIELARKGYNIAGITTKELHDIPSYGAAGYFALVSVKTSPDETAALHEINNESFWTYKKIYLGMHPYIPSDAVRYMPVFCSRLTEAGVEGLEAYGLIPKREYVTLDFGNGVLHPGFVRYMTYFINTTRVMNYLHAEVARLGIPIDVKPVQSFSEVKESVIFNCTGLGARELNQDSKMTGVRGHLILLTPEAGKAHMDYMIYTKVIQDGREEYVYMFPKDQAVTSKRPSGIACMGVVGGTFLKKTDQLSNEQKNELDQDEFRKLRDRTSLFFTGKPFA